MTKLKSFVLRLPGTNVRNNGGVSPNANPAAIPGVEAIANTASALNELKVESLDLEEGERVEVADEHDTVAVGISMPFTLIEPKAASAAALTEGDSWGIASIEADGLDANAGAGVKVAVLDTGIADHEAFAGMNPIRKNFTDEVDYDINGHGSHCAGTIFGQDVGGRRIGIARGVREPLIGKVLGQGGGGSEEIMQAILWARENGANVISMSLGMDFPNFQRLLVGSGLIDVEATSIALRAYRDNLRMFDILSRLFADGVGFNSPLLIAACGNENRHPHPGIDPPHYEIATAPPAAADDILSVGAIDKNEKIAYFSNTLPDCCAPGVDILSVDHNGGLKAISGTSMATPHVAGVATLEAARLSSSGSFTGRELRQAVLSNAKPVAGLSKTNGGVGKITVRNP